MCGIAGICNLNKSPVLKDMLVDMTSILSHRGPDCGGIWIDSNYGLGHRRLKVIDLSDEGNQPMSNEDANVWLVFNGEIYNYKELKNSLIVRGHRFCSHTDSEVIIHAYEEWGVECLEKFNGMFAFAIIDKRNERIFMARDRLGIKPLFYFLDKDQLIFASEIKALLLNPTLKREINIQTLDTFLAFNYVAAPQTMFKNITQLLPGEYMILQEGTLKKELYWDVSFVADECMTEKECDDGFSNLFTKAVKDRMSCDVPYGAFLSGGIDSSSIVCEMNKSQNAKVKTFSMDFAQKSYSESFFSQQVTKHLNVEHHMRKVECPAPDFFKNFVWYSEEPTADASFIPMFFLSELTREHVTMALSGDGADELMGGYETYLATILAGRYQKLPGFLRKKIIRPIINSIPISFAKTSMDYKLKTFVRGAELAEQERHYYWRMIFNQDFKNELYRENVKKNLGNFRAFDVVEPYFKKSKGDFLEKLMEVDTRFYLPNDMLVKVDRASMAHGLEVRIPFLDHHLVEFLARVPARLKFNWLMKGKFPLRRAMKGGLPKRVINQTKKGFNVPINIWFKDRWNGFMHEVLNQNNIKKTGIFSYKAVEKLMLDHEQGKADNGYRIYGLVCFMLWQDMFINKAEIVNLNAGKKKISSLIHEYGKAENLN
ncbi:MAG: asparagine synthase (glutamine-hydrolyzing) [Candidatus Omnitrophota bacterium]